MRRIEDVEKRWSLLFNTSIGVDLRAALRESDASTGTGSFDPCEDGLRSVCWKSFLLNGPLSKVSWTKKLKDSRSAYKALQGHFLRYINHPDDLHSSLDPLDDNQQSPWATLRQDEADREEIWKDVIRCNVDNFFFREPATQRKLLDILFIYAKLNPDTGYRQGMHELLAPILWVVYQDSINTAAVPSAIVEKDGADFMINVLDSAYVEHDAFNLFCAVMQTAKTFYELGDSKDSSVVISQSERIHRELLAAVDPDLAHHLQVIGVVPQIFAIRWLRLLFGREFEFKDVLKSWDVLFAESMSVEVIDMACVALLLRMRWQLIDADYTTAITTLSRFSLSAEDTSRAVMYDALSLVQERSPANGAMIIDRRTGKAPHVRSTLDSAATPNSKHQRLRSPNTSPSSTSQARFSTPQRQLEGLFANVTTNFGKNADWGVQNVSKAIRGAVGEVKRNVEHFQAQAQQVAHARAATFSVPQPVIIKNDDHQDVDEQLQALRERNRALGKMLEQAQESLRSWKAAKAPAAGVAQLNSSEDVFNTALAKIQFVSVYLADEEIPLPPITPVMERKHELFGRDESSKADSSLEREATVGQSQPSLSSTTAQGVTEKSSTASPSSSSMAGSAAASATVTETERMTTVAGSQHKPRPLRPSLAESSFSFMLGEPRNRTSFVRSTPLPEQKREQERTLGSASTATSVSTSASRSIPLSTSITGTTTTATSINLHASNSNSNLSANPHPKLNTKSTSSPTSTTPYLNSESDPAMVKHKPRRLKKEVAPVRSFHGSEGNLPGRTGADRKPTNLGESGNTDENEREVDSEYTEDDGFDSSSIRGGR